MTCEIIQICLDLLKLIVFCTKLKFAKNVKNSAFWAFCATFIKKCEKTVFFHVFRDTLYKVRQKCGKNAFFELFAPSSAKSVRKQCYSLNLNICQILSTGYWCCQRCEKLQCCSSSRWPYVPWRLPINLVHGLQAIPRLGPQTSRWHHESYRRSWKLISVFC